MSAHGTQSFARHTGLVAIGQAAVKSTQLVLAIVLVRMLDPDGWNAAAFLLSIYLAGTTIGSLNVQHGIVFFLPRVDVTEQRSLVVRTMGLLAAVGLAIALALVVAAPALTGGRLADADQIPALGLAIALELPAACVPMALIAVERYGAAAVWDLLGTAIFMAATIVPVAAGLGVPGLVAGLCVAGALRSLIGLVVVRHLLGSGRPLPVKTLMAQLSYSLPLGLTVAVAMLNRLTDKWFVAAFRPGDFGVYAVAAQEIPLLAVLPYAGGAALVTALVAAFRDDDIATARTHWLHLTMTMSAVVVPVGMVVVIVAPELLHLVFTPEFERGVLSFQLFTLVTLHRVAEYGMLLRAAGRTRDLLQVAAATLAANIVLAGIGAYVAGMTGASLGTVIASGIGWLVALRKIAAVLEVPVRDAFAWRSWLTCVGLAIAAALATVVVVERLETGSGIRLLLKVVVFGALFATGYRAWRRTPHSTIPAAVVVPERRPLATSSS